MHELKITVAKNNRHWKMTDEAVTEFRGLEYGWLENGRKNVNSVKMLSVPGQKKKKRKWRVVSVG